MAHRKLDKYTQEVIVEHIQANAAIHKQLALSPKCRSAELAQNDPDSPENKKNYSDKYFALYQAASDDAQASLGILVHREENITYRYRTQAQVDLLKRDKAQAKAHLYAIAYGINEFLLESHHELLDQFPTEIIQQIAAKINDGKSDEEIEKLLKDGAIELYETLAKLHTKNKPQAIRLGASEIGTRVEAYRDMGIAMRDPASTIVTVGSPTIKGNRKLEIETPLTQLTEQQIRDFTTIANPKGAASLPLWFTQIKEDWQKKLICRYAKAVALGYYQIPVQIAFLPVMRNFWEKTDAVLTKDAKELNILGYTYHSGAPSMRRYAEGSENLIDEQIREHLGNYANTSFMQTDPKISPDYSATTGVLKLPNSWFFGIGSSNITNAPYALWGKNDAKEKTALFANALKALPAKTAPALKKREQFVNTYILKLESLNEKDDLESHIERAVLMQLLFEYIKEATAAPRETEAQQELEEALKNESIKKVLALESLLFNCKSGIDRTGIFSTMLSIYRQCEFDLKTAPNFNENAKILDEAWDQQFVHTAHIVIRNSHAAFMTGQVTPGVNGIKKSTIKRPFPLGLDKNNRHYLTHWTANYNHSLYGKANQGDLKKIAVLPASFYLMGIAATAIEDSFFNNTQHFYDEDGGTIGFIFLSLAVAAGFYTFFAYHLSHKKEQFSFSQTGLKTIASLLAMGGAPLALESFLRPSQNGHLAEFFKDNDMLSNDDHFALFSGLIDIAAMAAIASALRCLVVFAFELMRNPHSRDARFDFKHYAFILFETLLCVFAAELIAQSITGELTFQPTEDIPEFSAEDHMNLQAAAAGCSTAAALSFGLNGLAHYKKVEIFSDKSNSAYLQYSAPTKPSRADVLLQSI